MKTFSTKTISDNVAHTLFITLYMRSRESRRPDRIINDPDACRIVDSVDYDFSKYEKAIRSQIGTCIRVRHFDDLTRKFITDHDNPVIINVGCGLDSRSSRVDMDKGIFYNIDLPEVMEVRDQLLPPDERNISIHKSMFDASWIRDIRDNHPQANFLVMSEGVLMYFSKEEVRPVLERIADILSPGELLFDACTSFGCKLSSKHDTVKFTDARFRWALDDNAEPEKWAANLSLKEATYFMDKEKHRWDFMSKLMGHIPLFSKAFRILHFDIAPATS